MITAIALSTKAAEVVPASVWDQIPVVALFGVFCVLLLRGFQKFVDNRDRTWNEQAAARDLQWQTFLQNQRLRDGESLTAMTKTLDALCTSVEESDKRAETRYSDLNNRIALHHSAIELTLKTVDKVMQRTIDSVADCEEVQSLKKQPQQNFTAQGKRK